MMHATMPPQVWLLHSQTNHNKDKSMSSNKQEPKWIKSPAKAYLLDLIEKGKVPSTLKPREVHDEFCVNRPEFQAFGYKHFSNRLRALREKVADRNDRADRDAAALASDRLLHPRPNQDGFGLPYWPDSEAKEVLCEDIDRGNHLTMTKEQLWSSKPEHYESFPFDVFVKHVHQEVKTRKFHAYIADKAKKVISENALKHMPFAK